MMGLCRQTGTVAVNLNNGPRKPISAGLMHNHSPTLRIELDGWRVHPYDRP